MKKFLRSEFAKKNFFLVIPKIFLFLVVLRFLEFPRNLHRISSTDLKFHLKICIHSKVITFWIFPKIFATFYKNAKCYNFWMDACFLDEILNLSMKFDVDYDETLKNVILLKTKKILGVTKKNFFLKTLIAKIFS